MKRLKWMRVTSSVAMRDMARQLQKAAFREGLENDFLLDHARDRTAQLFLSLRIALEGLLCGSCNRESTDALQMRAVPTQFFNVYPLFHTAALYDGFRRDLKTRALIIARNSYLGERHNGTIFWSSDISGNWDTLRRQVPTGINFCLWNALLEHRYRWLATSAEVSQARPRTPARSLGCARKHRSL